MKGEFGVHCMGDRAMRLVLSVILIAYLCFPASSAFAVIPEPDETTAASSQEPPNDDSQGARDRAGGASDQGARADGSPSDDGAQEPDGVIGGESTTNEGGNGSENGAVADEADSARGADGQGEGGQGEGGEGEQDSADQAAQAPLDLTSAWEAGQARVQDAGAYVLSADVTASEPLVVALPEGASATVDFAGYDVTVQDGATCAIDLSRNNGTVTFTDSTYAPSHEEALRVADAIKKAVGSDGGEGGENPNNAQNPDSDGDSDDGNDNDERDSMIRALAPTTSVTLIAKNAQADVAAVNAVRQVEGDSASEDEEGDQGDAQDDESAQQREEPQARFENLRIAIKNTVTKPASYGKNTAAVRTGRAPLDEGADAGDDGSGDGDANETGDASDGKAVSESADKPEPPEEKVSFSSCSLDVKVTRDVRAKALKRAGLSKEDQGSALALDALARGVLLDGYFSAFVETAAENADARDTVTRGESDAADEGERSAQLASAFAKTYTIGPDFMSPDDVTFGYPEQARDQSKRKAVVASASKGDVIDARMVEKLKAEAGYSGRVEAVSEKQGGFKRFSLFAEQGEGGLGFGSRTALASETGATGAAASSDGASSAESAAENADEQGYRYSMSRLAGSSRALSSQSVADSLAEQVNSIAVQADEVDLNKAWSDAEGGLSSAFTISSGGTYSLSDDLTAKSNLTIDAAGEDVTIAFNGHAFTINGAGATTEKTMVNVKAARSVTFDGSSDSGVSTLVSAGKSDIWGISSAAEGCAVTMRNLAVRMSSESNSQRILGTHCVRVTSGTLLMSGCSVSMDMGNQALRSTDYLVYEEVSSAVYATGDVERVTLNDCTVVGTGPSGFSLSDLNDTSSIGNAYAVYSLAKSTTVTGGSYTASSRLGSATCLYGTALGVSGSSTVSLQANAGQVAAGILSTAAQSAVIDAPISFSVGTNYEGMAQAIAALRSTVDNGFVLSPGCATGPEGSLTALVMEDDLASANDDGAVIGSFSQRALATQQAIVVRLANAFGDDAPCEAVLDSDSNNVRFGLVESRAIASVSTSSAMTYHATLASAIQHMASGATLTLLGDVGDIVISDLSRATLDLNNHTVTFLEYSDSSVVPGLGLTVKNGTIAGTRAISEGGLAALRYAATSPLSLSKVRIVASASDNKVSGIYVSGNASSLSLEDTSVEASASRVAVSSSSADAYGIRFANSSSASLSVKGSSSLDIATASAGVSACGLSSPGKVDLNGTSIRVSGTDTAIGAVQVQAGGELSATNVRIDVSTSAHASQAYGIWGVSTGQKSASVLVKSCSINVGSAVEVSDALYACLMGASSDSGASSVSWTLAGANTFKSASGTHIGKNVATINLAADFSLASASDSPLFVSQSARTDDVGFNGVSVYGYSSRSDISDAGYEALFKPLEDSYYESWALSAEGSSLVWRPEDASAGSDAVVLVHSGSLSTYSSVSDALARAASGDTVRLTCDVSEADALTVSVDDLDLDLNGHTLTLRPGDFAKAGSSNVGAALTYSGKGQLSVHGGTLTARVGAAIEASSASVYQGASVSGGGTLSIEEDARFSVSYRGGANGIQRDVSVRGITVTDGALSLLGTCAVSSARADDVVGAMDAYGVYAQAASGKTAKVDQSENAVVSVTNNTSVNTTKSTYYAEQGSVSSGVEALREIYVDESLDQELYNDIVAAFRVAATYDDPDDSSSSFGARVYYAEDLKLSHEGAWYDGMRVWAYTDPVSASDVGKLSSIVPTHFFTNTHYDALPAAYGIVTSADSQGASEVNVTGDVVVKCVNGDASALDARAHADTKVTWRCAAKRLSAQADAKLHAVRQKEFDLRDFIEFEPSQSQKVAYRATGGTYFVTYRCASARDAVIGEGIDFTLDGSPVFSTSGTDEAVLATQGKASATIAAGFHADSGACTVAHADGANTEGASFAKAGSGARVDAAVFKDAYCELEAASQSDGSVVWAKRQGAYVVAFKALGAVVKRYDSPTSVDLSEVSALAARTDDGRHHYEVVGWSTNPDENAASGYSEPSQTVTTRGAAVYNAVYSTSMKSGINITFSNVFSSDGSLQDIPTCSATYGQTVKDALAASKVAFPVPEDYASGSTTMRFVGWHLYSASQTASPLMYDSDEAASLAVTLALNGVSNNELVLWAVYMPAKENQHVVTFKADSQISAYVADDGSYPSYVMSNNTNTNYVVPAKIETKTGVTYTFGSWKDDASGTAYASVLPRVGSDAAYKAQFNETPSDVSMTFLALTYDEESDTYSLGTRHVATTYEQTAQEIADSVVTYGNKIGYGGKVYTFEGWAVRKTDVEALYTKDNPILSGSWDERIVSSQAYSRTYYGIYSTADHYVDVTFYDGQTALGTAHVLATRTIDDAFSVTGASTPSDKSVTSAFLGWAKDSADTEAIDGIATSVESALGDAVGEKLDLYAVYGSLPSYTVRLRNAEGDKVLYEISVGRGRTVNSVLSQQGVTLSVATQEGSFFAGWSTAAGALFSLDTPISGSANLYATYRPITVVSSDADDINATVSSTSSQLYGAASATFTLSSRATADLPVRNTMSKNSYSTLKCYDMKLVATSAEGVEQTVTGEFGLASIKVKVDSSYNDSSVRAFWLGSRDGAEDVLNSDKKTIDDAGYIAVSIGNYLIGDVDEGGNLAIGYIERNQSASALSSKSKSKSSSTKSSNNADSSSTTRSNTTKSTSSPTSRSRNSTSPSSESHLRTNPDNATRSPSRSSRSGSSGSVGGTLSGRSSGGSGGSGGSSGSNDADSAGESVASAEVAEAEESAEPSLFDGWDSDAVALIVIALAVIALVVRGLWQLIVVRPRRSEEGVELPSVADRYAEGFNF